MEYMTDALNTFTHWLGTPYSEYTAKARLVVLAIVGIAMFWGTEAIVAKKPLQEPRTDKSE